MSASIKLNVTIPPKVLLSVSGNLVYPLVDSFAVVKYINNAPVPIFTYPKSSCRWVKDLNFVFF